MRSVRPVRGDAIIIRQVEKGERLEAALDAIGMGAALGERGSALIKVNLASPPEPGHPRTHAALLASLIRYVVGHGARCAIAEGADGFLSQNLEALGLGRLAREQRVELIDLDLEAARRIIIDGEVHYLPKRLKDYGVRIGLPLTSQRPGMLFSNNVKLFVGAVPRRYYQLGEPGSVRPRMHLDLQGSIARVYRAVMSYALFHYYVNGGRALVEGRGEFELEPVLVGDDAVELDAHVLNAYGLDPPEYIEMLRGRG